MSRENWIVLVSVILLILLIVYTCSSTKKIEHFFPYNDNTVKITPVQSDTDIITNAFNAAIKYNVLDIPDVSGMTKEPFYLAFPYDVNPGLIAFIQNQLAGVTVVTVNSGVVDLSNDSIKVIKNAYNVYKMNQITLTPIPVPTPTPNLTPIPSSTSTFYVFDVDISDDTQWFDQTLRFFIKIDDTSSEMTVLGCLNEIEHNSRVSYNPYNNVDKYTLF